MSKVQGEFSKIYLIKEKGADLSVIAQQTRLGNITENALEEKYHNCVKLAMHLKGEAPKLERKNAAIFSELNT